jgi:hypothetical protein
MGLEPVAVYPGRVSEPWDSKCLVCGHQPVSPTTNTVTNRMNRWVKNGGTRPNACKNCGDSSRAATVLLKGYATTQERLAELGWILLTPLAEYQGQKSSRPVSIRCANCGFENQKIGQTIRKKCRCSWGEDQLGRWFIALKQQRPELFSQIIRERTPDIVFERLGVASRELLWWRCTARNSPPHEYARTVEAQVFRGGKCPICFGPCVFEGLNDLATFLLDNDGSRILDEWYEDQGEIVDCVTRNRVTASPKLLKPFSNFLANWKCAECSHVWAAPVTRRSLQRSGCPLCSNRTVVSGENDLVSRGEEIIDQWSWDLNTANPAEVYALSPQNFWWRCSTDPVHLWQASPYNRLVNGSGCPSCADRGYNPSRAGILYLLRNERLGSGKFGITNVGTTRLDGFRRQGWEIEFALQDIDGRVAKFAEQYISGWFRGELGLPPYLQKGDILFFLGGQTETFELELAPQQTEILSHYRLAWESARKKVVAIDEAIAPKTALHPQSSVMD